MISSPWSINMLKCPLTQTEQSTLDFPLPSNICSSSRSLPFPPLLNVLKPCQALPLDPHLLPFLDLFKCLSTKPGLPFSGDPIGPELLLAPGRIRRLFHIWLPAAPGPALPLLFQSRSCPTPPCAVSLNRLRAFCVPGTSPGP